MKLNTYVSEVVPDYFVTLPAATAAATISLVDALGALRLSLCEAAHELPDATSDSPFVVSVLTQIVDRGYAVHGPPER